MAAYFLDLAFFLALGFTFFLGLAFAPQQQPMITSLPAGRQAYLLY